MMDDWVKGAITSFNVRYFIWYYAIFLTGYCWGVWIYILSGPGAILKYGRSKHGYKKFMKSMSWSDRLLRRNYVQLSKTAKRLQKFFIIMTYVFYVLILLLIILVIIYAFYPKALTLIQYYLIIKGCFIEFPTIIVCLSNLTQTKDGKGWEWKFLLEWKNKN